MGRNGPCHGSQKDPIYQCDLHQHATHNAVSKSKCIVQSTLHLCFAKVQSSYFYTLPHIFIFKALKIFLISTTGLKINEAQNLRIKSFLTRKKKEIPILRSKKKKKNFQNSDQGKSRSEIMPFPDHLGHPPDAWNSQRCKIPGRGAPCTQQPGNH